MIIKFESKCIHIAYSIGLFSKEQIIIWADRIIERFDVPEIPDAVFDLSMVKKEEDIPRLLIELGTSQEEDKALKTVVGILNQSYKNCQNTLYEICEYLYRLSNYVDRDHDWSGYLYAIIGNLETALDGYGDVDTSIEEIEEFLTENEEHFRLFDHQLSPNEPNMSEFKPRREFVNIDVSQVFAPLDLHMTLKRQLDLPDIYGMNWNAFWDAITGMVKLPKKINITGWSVLVQRFPEEAKTLRGILTDYSLSYNRENFTVDYE